MRTLTASIVFTLVCAGCSDDRIPHMATSSWTRVDVGAMEPDDLDAGGDAAVDAGADGGSDARPDSD